MIARDAPLPLDADEHGGRAPRVSSADPVTRTAEEQREAAGLLATIRRAGEHALELGLRSGRIGVDLREPVYERRRMRRHPGDPIALAASMAAKVALRVSDEGEALVTWAPGADAWDEREAILATIDPVIAARVRSRLGPIAPWTLPIRHARVRAMVAAQHDHELDEHGRPVSVSEVAHRRAVDAALLALEIGVRSRHEARQRRERAA